MKLAFDIGMYDGSDSRYLLDQGFRVIAVEANPDLAARATHRFHDEIADGRLVVVNRAIASTRGDVELSVCGDDLGSSTIFHDKIADRRRTATFTVGGIPFTDLVREHGVPDYLKVDIEGADRHCILALAPTLRPQYVSFEVDDDLEELLQHVASVGYRRFKLIGQCTFLELGHEHSVRERARRRLMRWLGFDEPLRIRRAGRWFDSMHSSGPAPWASDGDWYGAKALLATLRHAREHRQLTGWYDVHATV